MNNLYISMLDALAISLSDHYFISCKCFVYSPDVDAGLHFLANFDYNEDDKL